MALIRGMVHNHGSHGHKTDGPCVDWAKQGRQAPTAVPVTGHMTSGKDSNGD